MSEEYPQNAASAGRIQQAPDATGGVSSRNHVWIFETERLKLRQLDGDDFAALSQIMRDEITMHAYEGAFSGVEIKEWIERQMRRYEYDGFGLWAVVMRETNEVIGQCGLTLQDYSGKLVVEVGYLFARTHWHQGFATEAAIACREYAFHTVGADEVYSIIRDTNDASIQVAKRNGMIPVDTMVKHYRGIDMPHIVYRVER
ncbi:MAG: GNAT family N-acetyltransferase [Raoultibacter sp.]